MTTAAEAADDAAPPPESAGTADPFDVAVARDAPEPLAAFNRAGVLDATDVHVAARLAALTGDDDPAALLAAALAARAPRLGHVCVDLAAVRDTVTVDADEPADLRALDWPDPVAWPERLAGSPQVAVGADGADDRPLRLEGTRLYLDRYWRYEQQVAADLRRRAAAEADGVDEGLLADGLARLFDGEAPDLQRLAAAAAVRRRVAVIAGGPGTGKTTTVARLLALLGEQAAASGEPPPRVALAAPTGKAAKRLQDAVAGEAGALDVAGDVRERVGRAEAATLHRLLGWRPGNRSRFRHHRGNRLPHDAVVVDETSMVSLSLMAKLADAVRPGARLVLLGDPQQLASVEAGAVLGDIVGPAVRRLRMRPEARDALGAVTGQPVPAEDPPAAASAVGDGIVLLRRVHRYREDSRIAALAHAVQVGDADAAVAALHEPGEDVRWVEADVAADDAGALEPVRAELVAAGRSVAEAARAGRAREALDALGSLRLLCAHRRGPYGVARWNPAVEGWLAAEADGLAAEEEWYAGRPLLVTANDYALGLYNGDVGVVVAADDGRVLAAFDRGGQVVTVPPARLAGVETVHAMTVHKSQGSQFAAVTVVLPEPGSRLLTRELLYTAVTRARERLTLVATEESVRTAVTSPIARASGLREQLWGADDAGAG